MAEEVKDDGTAYVYCPKCGRLLPLIHDLTEVRCLAVGADGKPCWWGGIIMPQSGGE